MAQEQPRHGRYPGLPSSAPLASSQHPCHVPACPRYREPASGLGANNPDPSPGQEDQVLSQPLGRDPGLAPGGPGSPLQTGLPWGQGATCQGFSGPAHRATGDTRASWEAPGPPEQNCPGSALPAAGGPPTAHRTTPAGPGTARPRPRAAPSAPCSLRYESRLRPQEASPQGKAGALASLCPGLHAASNLDSCCLSPPVPRLSSTSSLTPKVKHPETPHLLLW